MDNWEFNSVELGDLQIGHSYTVKFYYTGEGTVKLNAKNKQVISKDCGCYNGVYHPDEKTLVVNYVPKPLPNKDKNKGFNYYQSTKSINITMVEGQESKIYTLKFSSTNHVRLQRLMP